MAQKIGALGDEASNMASTVLTASLIVTPGRKAYGEGMRTGLWDIWSIIRAARVVVIIFTPDSIMQRGRLLGPVVGRLASFWHRVHRPLAVVQWEGARAENFIEEPVLGEELLLLQ